MGGTVLESRSPNAKTVRELTDEDYRALAAFRAGLRHFLHHSGQAARALGLTPQQHQILIAIRGHSGPEPPIVGDLATALQVRHHTAVEIIDRMERMGLVRRVHSSNGRRRVHVLLTQAGNDVLQQLAEANWTEYHILHEKIEGLLRQLQDHEIR